MDDLDFQLSEEEYLTKSLSGKLEEALADYDVVVSKGTNHVDIDINGLNFRVMKKTDSIIIDDRITLKIDDFIKVVEILKER